MEVALKPTRLITTALLLTAAPIAAQQPRQLTAEDYARAERFLGANTFRLVTGVAGAPTWLDDGRFWYRATTADGAEFVMVDPARGTRSAAFDHTRLAAALASVTGGNISAAQLPIQSLEFSTDAREITVRVSNRNWTCSLQTYTCAAADAGNPAAA